MFVQLFKYSVSHWINQRHECDVYGTCLSKLLHDIFVFPTESNSKLGVINSMYLEFGLHSEIAMIRQDHQHKYN